MIEGDGRGDLSSQSPRSVGRTVPSNAAFSPFFRPRELCRMLPRCEVQHRDSEGLSRLPELRLKASARAGDYFETLISPP